MFNCIRCLYHQPQTPEFHIRRPASLFPTSARWLLTVHVCNTVTFGKVRWYRESTIQIVSQLKSILPDYQALCQDLFQILWHHKLCSYFLFMENQNSFWGKRIYFLYYFSIYNSWLFFFQMVGCEIWRRKQSFRLTIAMDLTKALEVKISQFKSSIWVKLYSLKWKKKHVISIFREEAHFPTMIIKLMQLSLPSSIPHKVKAH